MHNIPHLAFIEKVLHKFIQILNKQVQQVVNNNNNQHQPSVVIEETVTEDATFPEQVAQEIIIKDDSVTHISAGSYNGFIQVYGHQALGRKWPRKTFCGIGNA